MVEAAEHVGAALSFAAHHGATMRAGIEDRGDVAGLAARKDQAAAGDAAGEKIAGLRNFRLVPEIQPALAEDLAPLNVEHAGFDEGAPRHAKDALCRSVIDQRKFRNRRL